MRYYVVGTPVQDLQGSLFWGVNAKTFTQEELQATSFYSQNTIRLFTSYDQAKEYSHGLRENAYDYSHFPKTALSRSKVRPVFTVELTGDIEVGNLHIDSFEYGEHYIDKQHYEQTRKKELELSFYEINPILINKENIIRAEFYKSCAKTVEFIHTAPNNSGCLVM